VGVFRDGAWAEYCVVPAAQVYRLDPGSDLAWGALAEPISCILHGWDRLQPVTPDQSVVILGAGLIGLLWAILLRQYGFKNVVISEVSGQRIERARRLGFKADKPADRSDNLTRDAFDIVIDCSGNPKAVEEAVDWLRPLGKLLLFGICPEDTIVRMNPFRIFQKELSILGSVINPFTFTRAIEFLKTLTFPLEDLGVAFFPLDAVKEAIDAARDGRSTKILFKVMPSPR
jgi:threonine dehydrogenase-like Zn-dependent dehydrogenase